MKRVKQYECEIHNKQTDARHVRICEFTYVQVESVGGILHEDGVDVNFAQALCDRWTQWGNHDNIRYTYRILDQ